MSIFSEYVSKAAAGKEKSCEDWLSSIAQNAKNCVLATHIGKFIHPDAKVSYFYEREEKNFTGYVYTNNTSCKLDIICPAQYIGTASFLLLNLEDGSTVLEHLQKNSEVIALEFAALKVDYTELREAFLQIQEGNPNYSDERIKQVYFPVGNEYHLLSILTSSGMLTALREKVLQMGSHARDARDEKSEHYKESYSRIYDLTEMGFGGTKPQNISFLNSQNRGKAFLLSSLPPTLSEKAIRKPKNDFFSNCLYKKAFQTEFYELNKIYYNPQNNMETREARKEIYRAIVDKIMNYVYELRELESGWSDDLENLSAVQKIWLDSKYEDERLQDKEKWLKEIAKEITRWIMLTYEALIKNSVHLGKGEFTAFTNETKESLEEDKKIIMEDKEAFM